MSIRSLSPYVAALAAGLLAQAGAQAAAAPARSAAPASAADALAQESPGTAPGTPQRSKMKTCNADAKTQDLHGDDRRKFMSHCLSGKPAAPHS